MLLKKKKRIVYKFVPMSPMKDVSRSASVYLVYKNLIKKKKKKNEKWYFVQNK